MNSEGTMDPAITSMRASLQVICVIAEAAVHSESFLGASSQLVPGAGRCLGMLPVSKDFRVIHDVSAEVFMDLCSQIQTRKLKGSDKEL